MSNFDNVFGCRKNKAEVDENLEISHDSFDIGDYAISIGGEDAGEVG